MAPENPFVLGPAIEAPYVYSPYRRSPDDPAFRELTIYTQDPATSRFDAGIAKIQVPYEPVDPGPTGKLFYVHDYDDSARRWYPPVELDTVQLALAGGLAPSTMDPRYAQQMVYALAVSTYDQFALALGRYPTFGFGADMLEPHPRLKLRPHAMREENAWYDPDAREVAFGYYRAGAKSRWLTQPGDLVFTSLSHDVVVHELSHAMLDGIRTQFLLPTNRDVSAFHEAFADLVAVFQRFRHRDLVRHAISREKGALTSRIITDLARQFGQTASDGNGRTALRTAILDMGGADDDVPPEFRYRENREEHDLGAILLTAVFEAFRRVYERKTERLRRACGEVVNDDLVDLLTDKACRLAEQFLSIVIRAVDYCPPVDLTFGEYLRALITADREMVPDDTWGYREALVLAFRRYGIKVNSVRDLSEPALLWCAPDVAIRAIDELAYQNLKPPAHPAEDVDDKTRRERADAIGKLVSQPLCAKHFGLRHVTTDTREIERPVVQSVRTVRRVSPDRHIRYGIVAEITQRKRVQLSERRSYWFYGGSTVVLNDQGVVRYSIAKWVDSEDRLERFKKHVATLDRDSKDMLRSAKPDRSAMYRRLHGASAPSSTPRADGGDGEA